MPASNSRTYQPHRPPTPSRDQGTRRPTPCHRCDGIGWLIYATTGPLGPRNRAYRCSCPNGDHLSSLSPRLDLAFPDIHGATQTELDRASDMLRPDSRSTAADQGRGIAFLRDVLTGPLLASLNSWVARGCPEAVTAQVLTNSHFSADPDGDGLPPF